MVKIDTAEDELLDVEPLTLPSVLSPLQQEFHTEPPEQAPTPHTEPTKIPDTSACPHESSKRPGSRPGPHFLNLPPKWEGYPALTVSAVLSRSGQLHPLPSRQNSIGDSQAHWNSYFQTWENDPPSPEHTNQLNENYNEDTLLSSMPAALRDLVLMIMKGSDPKPKQKRVGQHHTGSALEAIGALFLRQDSGGRLAHLSLNRSWTGKTSSSRLRLPLWLTIPELRPLIASLNQWRKRLITGLRESIENEHHRPGTQSSTENDLPGTPLMMPGGFLLDNDEFQMLPPPLLDESSDAHSFEGLLGVRRMREQQARSQHLDQLRAANRPAHRTDVFTAFFNFVRSAQASELRQAKSGSQPCWPTQFHAPELPPLPHEQRKHTMAHEAEAAMSSALPPRPVLMRRSTMADTTSLAPRPGSSSAVREGSNEGPDSWGPEPPSPLDCLPQKDTTSSPLIKDRLTPSAMLENSTPLRGSPASQTPSRKSNDSTPAWKNEAILSDMWVVISFLLVCVTFVPDFVVFLLAHLLDVLIDVYECIINLLWFLRWVWKNVTGQTILGRIVIDSYFMFQNEWEHVVREDHEGTGDPMRRLFGIPLFPRPRGLSTVQVLRGLLELACIQAVTRRQYESEGAGLVLLDQWQRHEAKGEAPLNAENPDANNDEEDGNEDLLVTSQSVDILELSRGQSSFTGEGEREAAQDASAILWNEDQTALVRNIKWAGQLAMSAYGLRVLIVDLPPVFTPSGQQLPRQTFAHLTRLDADDVLHADIQTLDMEATYVPTFYVVRDMKRKVVCVAVRGTQSFADIVVDLDMKTEDITASLAEWRGMEVDETAERYAYHAGIWRAAKTLVSPGSTLFQKLCETLNEHSDFGLVLVGHSLGGAIASAAAILLSEYHLENPNDDPRKGIWRTSAQEGFPGGRPIRAIAFGHPSTLSHTLQRRTSYGRVPLVTTVILGSDIIPRFGHGQLRELRRVLGALTRVRRRRGKVSTSMGSAEGAGNDDDDDISVHILRRFWDWSSIRRTKNPDAVMRNRQARLEALFWRLRCAVENDLFSKAKGRFDQAVAQHAVAQHASLSPWIPPSTQTEVPLHALSSRRQRLDYATLRSETAQGGVLVPAGRVIWLSQGELYDVINPMAFFSLPDLRTTMFADHFPAAYEEAILRLGRGGAHS